MADPRTQTWTITSTEKESNVIDLESLNLCGVWIDSSYKGTAVKLVFFEGEDSDGTDGKLIIGTDGAPLEVDLSSVQAPGTGFTAAMISTTENRVSFDPGKYSGLRYVWCGLVDASYNAVAATGGDYVVKPIVRFFK